MVKANRSLSKQGSISNFGVNPGFITNKSGSVGPRSLNISVRKQENMRIEREN